MSLRCVDLPKSPLEMDREEIKLHLEGQSWAILMRSLLVYEIGRVREAKKGGETIESRTLRSLWYTLVKPSLDKLGALEKSYFTSERVKQKDIGKVPDWDGLMSKYLVQLVDDRWTSYEELAIIDGSRQRRPPRKQSLSVRSVETVGVHHPNLVLFTEKDTIYGIVESIAALYGISVLSGSGKPSYAATENLIRKMIGHPKFQVGCDITILTLTDYDPSGYIISTAVVKQMAKVSATLPKVGKVAYRRLGLEPEQLTPEELAKNTYTPAPAGLKKWFEETGGVNDKPLGLELDALPISRIRDLFVDGLQAVIGGEEEYHRDLARALVDLLIWEGMAPQIEEMRNFLFMEIEAAALANSLRCPADIMAQFARAGAGHIDPLEYDEHIFTAAPEIREKVQHAMRQYLGE